MKELVQCVENIKTVVNSINESTFEKHYKVPLDCSGLPILSPDRGFECNAQLPDFFNALDVTGDPALYWFIVTSNHTSQEIIDKIIKVAGKVKRTFPLLNKKRAYSSQSRVLYVGKTKTELKSRMVSHLGYHKKSQNHGLQLCHWATDLELKLELNYISLPREVEPLAEFFERELSKRLKPILGRQV